MANPCVCGGTGCTKCAHEVRMSGDDYRARESEVMLLKERVAELEEALSGLIYVCKNPVPSWSVPGTLDACECCQKKCLRIDRVLPRSYDCGVKNENI